MPTAIETFSGHWMTLPENSVCQLGDSPETGSLGVTTILGSRFWDCQLKFRIRVGPMGLAELTPPPARSAESFKRLRAWVLTYVELRAVLGRPVVLKKEEVPEISLGQSGMLGWTCWLRSQPFDHDADDLILDGSS